jgi:hypothetical protein
VLEKPDVVSGDCCIAFQESSQYFHAVLVCDRNPSTFDSRANHSWSADIDGVVDVFVGCFGIGHRSLQVIKGAANPINQGPLQLSELVEVLFSGQQSAMQFGNQRNDAMSEYGASSAEGGYIGDLVPVFFKEGFGTAGREEDDSFASQLFCETGGCKCLLSIFVEYGEKKHSSWLKQLHAHGLIFGGVLHAPQSHIAYNKERTLVPTLSLFYYCVK